MTPKPRYEKTDQKVGFFALTASVTESLRTRLSCKTYNSDHFGYFEFDINYLFRIKL